MKDAELSDENGHEAHLRGPEFPSPRAPVKGVGCRKLDQTVPASVACCFSPITRAGLVKHISYVSVNCGDADQQFLGNLPVGLASGDKAQHLHLSLGQAVGVGWGFGWLGPLVGSLISEIRAGS